MKNYKKITLKFPTPSRYKTLFKLINKCEILQIYRFNEDYAIYTQKFVFKSNKSNPKDLEKLCNLSLEVLSENKNKNEYICLVKCQWDEELHRFFNNTDLMIYPPVITDEKYMTVTYLTAVIYVDSLIERYKKIYGDQLNILNITSIQPDLNNLSMLLTEKQKSIIYYAVERGYYEIPRKASSDDLAEHFNITKSALYEHLRKIERKVFRAICQ
ncbi:MAG: hypothetical protein EAX91_11525 [Candidatus Lokiarchaeota archaeon]|nr:hypothetical protein [Candidatus Lokiarchaeota archaeon]